MPYFSGPNGIREVADAGERFQQSFQDSRRKRLLSDYFATGNADLGQLARLDPEAAQQIQNQQKQQGLAKMFADLYAAPEAERPKGIAALLAQDPQLGQQAMKTFDPRFAGAGSELPSDIRSLQYLQNNPELLKLDRERRQAGGMVPKLVQTDQGYGWGTPGAGIQLAPMGGVAGQPQPQGGEVPFAIDPSLPPEVQAAIRADPQQWDAAQDGAQVSIPPAQIAQPRDQVMTPYQQAQLQLSQNADQRAQADADRKQVSSQYTPQQRLNAQKVLQAAGKQQANIENIRTGLVRMRKALNALNTGMPFSTGTGLLQGRVSALGPEGQELQSAVGAIQNSMLALTRVPGVGTQSDRDSIVDERRYPSLTVDKSVNENTMKQLEDFAANLLGSFETETRSAQEIARGGQPQQQAPGGGSKYQVGQVIEAGGKRYRVTGGDPNDPDVEEVR